MQGAKGSGNARKETRERERERARRKEKKREREEAEQRAWKMRDETCRWMAMAWSVPEEWTRRRRKAERGGREARKGEREREWEKEKEREQACAAGHHNMFWLLRSVRSFLCTSVRLSVVCPGTPTECIAVWPRWRVSDRLSLGLYTLWGSFKRLSVLLLHLLLLRPFLLIAPRISAVFLPPLPPPPFSSSPPSLSSFFFPFFFFCFFFPSTRNSPYPRSAPLSHDPTTSAYTFLILLLYSSPSSFVEIIFVHLYQWSCNPSLSLFPLFVFLVFLGNFFLDSFAIPITRFLISLQGFSDFFLFSPQFFILVVFVEIIFCLYQSCFCFSKIPFYTDSRKKYSVGFDNGNRYGLIYTRWKYRRFVSSESNSSHKDIRGLQRKRIKVKNNAKRMVPWSFIRIRLALYGFVKFYSFAKSRSETIRCLNF